jgi:hypothetical protein
LAAWQGPVTNEPSWIFMGCISAGQAAGGCSISQSHATKRMLLPTRSRVALLPRTIWIDGWIWLSASPRTARRSTATSTEQVRGGIELLLYAKRRRWGDGRSATATGRRAVAKTTKGLLPRLLIRSALASTAGPPAPTCRPAGGSYLIVTRHILSSLRHLFISIVWCVPCAN